MACEEAAVHLDAGAQHEEVPGVAEALGRLGGEEQLEALELLDELCETDQARGWLAELGGLPVLFGLLEADCPDTRREAAGLLFRFGFRKGMDLDSLLARHRAAGWDPAVLRAAREGFAACFSQADYEHGKRVSMGEIDRCGLAVGCLAYGEAEFASFQQVLAAARPAAGDVFYDLGSGLGKAVVAAFLLGQFSKLVGYELLHDLAQSADQLLDRFRQQAIELGREPGTIRLEQADFLQADWSDGDIVYANATRYDPPLMQAIAAKAEQLKPGARLVLTTNPIESECFSLQRRGSSRVSWMGDIPQTFFVFVRD